MTTQHKNPEPNTMADVRLESELIDTEDGLWIGGWKENLDVVRFVATLQRERSPDGSFCEIMNSVKTGWVQPCKWHRCPDTDYWARKQSGRGDGAHWHRSERGGNNSRAVWYVELEEVWLPW